MKLQTISSSDLQRLTTLGGWRLRATVVIAASLIMNAVHAQTVPVVPCTAAGIGAVTLVGDGAPVTILSAETATTAAPASVPYCLVKVQIPTAINIWVGLPDRWNGRWQSLGGAVTPDPSLRPPPRSTTATLVLQPTRDTPAATAASA